VRESGDVILALDPGLNSPGIAIFREGVLLRADRANTSEHASLPDGERWLRVARVLAAFAAKYTGGTNALTVIFERPQWYQRGKSKGDPNQLVGIAGVAANLTGILSCRYHVSVSSPTPAEWIGQLPKTCRACGANKKKCPECRGSAWETPRGRFIRKRLSESELALVPDQNDAIDAVGLGLFALGRLKPHTVFSNGRDGR
jgi:hypothetical protein